jgi:TonB-dependent starch-binding outer membrane protein SusC
MEKNLIPLDIFSGRRCHKLLRTMKLFIVISFVLTINVAASTYSQEKRFSFDVRDQTVRDVFNVLEKQSKYHFFFNDDFTYIDKVVSLRVENENVEQVLDKMFSSSDITYRVFDNNLIVITPRQSLQTLHVTGKVIDASSGESLPGVSVVIENTTTGAISDVNGNYALDVKDQNTILLFSFVGFNPERVSVDGRTTIDVKLIPEIKSLDAVVVVGYGLSSRKKLASSVTSIDPGDLNRGAITDVGQMLQGKVPGLNITASGDPNKAAAVVLRGASTLNSSQSPFYVIDGIPGVDISTVSMDDIASVDILKDAAATSIYGNRAANGVIMITTKKGKSGQMQVSYNGYVGIEKVSNQLDMMDANQLRAFVKATKQSFSPTDDKNANTDWQSEIERSTAVSHSHNLSLTGGTAHNNYNASLSYMDKQGIILGSELSRVIGRLSVEQYALNDKLKFGLNITNSNNVAHNVPQRNVVLLQAVNHLPISPVKNADGTYFENFTNTGYFNPVAMINHGQDDTKYNHLVAGFNTHAALPFGITYDLNLSYQSSTYMHGEFYDHYYSNYNSANFYSNPDPPDTKTVLNFGKNGSALRSSYQDTRKVIENYLTWDRKFDKHYLNAVIGYSWQENVNGDGFQATTTNFPVDNIGYSNFALSNYGAVSSYVVNFGADKVYQKIRLISDFARLNYNYNEKYLLQASLRRDGSSVFGVNHRWGYFPSAGIGWRISEEGFMHALNFFDDLKLRGSYGVTGNSSGFNAYTARLVSGSLGTYYYNGVQTAAYGPTQADNPNLRWEKTSTTNIGLDFSLLKGRISGTLDWYNKYTDGMIYDYPVDQLLVPSGTITANGGSMSNKGIEMSLTVTPVRTTAMSWTTSLNVAHNENLIKSLTNPLFAGGDSVRKTQPDGGGQTGSTLQILKAGKPLGQFFTLQYAGKNAKKTSQYLDHNGNVTTSPSIGTDYHYAGSAQPKLLLGWSNTFVYKNWDLNVFIRGVFGNKIFNATRADLFRPTSASLNNILVDAAADSSDVNAFKYSTRFIEDGSYIRLDNATLGYNFKKISSSIKTLRVYASVNNLFTITGYKGVDPEVNQGGIAPGVDSNNFYPKTRTFLFGVNVTF